MAMSREDVKRSLKSLAKEMDEQPHVIKDKMLQDPDFAKLLFKVHPTYLGDLVARDPQFKTNLYAKMGNEDKGDDFIKEVNKNLQNPKIYTPNATWVEDEKLIDSKDGIGLATVNNTFFRTWKEEDREYKEYPTGIVVVERNGKRVDIYDKNKPLSDVLTSSASPTQATTQTNTPTSNTQQSIPEIPTSRTPTANSSKPSPTENNSNSLVKPTTQTTTPTNTSTPDPTQPTPETSKPTILTTNKNAPNPEPSKNSEDEKEKEEEKKKEEQKPKQDDQTKQDNGSKPADPIEAIFKQIADLATGKGNIVSGLIGAVVWVGAKLTGSKALMERADNLMNQVPASAPSQDNKQKSTPETPKPEPKSKSENEEEKKDVANNDLEKRLDNAKEKLGDQNKTPTPDPSSNQPTPLTPSQNADKNSLGSDKTQPQPNTPSPTNDTANKPKSPFDIPTIPTGKEPPKPV